MLKDTNLSTLLLLGVLLFLIYCLMKQPTVASENKLAESNDENEQDIEDDEEDQDMEEQFGNIRENFVDAEEVEGDDDEDSRDFTMDAPGVPDISDDLVNQLINETSTGPVNSTLLGNATSVFTFEPSDDSSHSGATLDNAFDKPVPESTQTDVVDLNRNNVTNYNAKDYLPKEINDDWFNTDFSQAKYKMNDDKLINVDKYIIGINTVGQSLKNASYDIRGSVNVPKYTVSPWNNSTIEPDYNIKPLC